MMRSGFLGGTAGVPLRRSIAAYISGISAWICVMSPLSAASKVCPSPPFIVTGRPSLDIQYFIFPQRLLSNTAHCQQNDLPSGNRPWAIHARSTESLAIVLTM